MSYTTSLPLSIEEILALKVASSQSLSSQALAASYPNTTTVIQGVTAVNASSTQLAGPVRSTQAKGGIRRGELILIGGMLLLLIAGVQYMKWQERKAEEMAKGSPYRA